MEQLVNKPLSKGALALAMIALCLGSIVMVNDLVLVPVAEAIYVNIGKGHDFAYNFLITGPHLTLTLTAFLGGKILQYISKRNATIITLGLFAVATICGVLVEKIYYMAIMRAIVGLCMGMFIVLVYAIIADLFVDEEKRTSMVGIYNGVQAVVAMIFSFVSGIVAGIGAWETVFNIYWVAVPVLILTVLFLPKDKSYKLSDDDKDFGEHDNKAGKPKFPFLNVFSEGMAYFMFQFAIFIVYYFMSFYISENNIGDTMVAGVMASIFSGGIIAGSFIFILLYRKLGRATIGVDFLVVALGYFILYIISGASPSLFVVGFMNVIIGMTYGIGFSYYGLRSTMITDPSHVSTAVGVIQGLSTLGCFLSSYFATLLMKVMGTTRYTETYPVVGGILIIMTVISFILTIREKRSCKMKETQEACV